MNTPFLSLVGSVLVVIATHCLVDFTNSYGWRPFPPFWDRWFYGDLVFIVDPYMWLILGGAIFLTAKRIILALFFWIAGGILLTYLVIVRDLISVEGRVVLFLWIVGTILLLALKRKRPVWGASAARYALLGVLLY